MVDFISGFFGPNRFLSNYWTAKVIYDGVEYPTSEHAFAAAKTLDSARREEIRQADSPGAAKRLGRTVVLRPGWDEGVAIQAMAEILTSKFSDPELAEKLIATGDAVLVETNSWHDQRWGDCNCGGEACAEPGMNRLGTLLMGIRAVLCSKV